MADININKQWLHQYQIVGRKAPTENDPEPTIYRMKVFAPNTVVAKSRFWYYLSKLRKVKKANGEVLAVNEIFEKRPSSVKNYGVWLRYKSRSDTVNMYKEYRDITMTSAVEQMYKEMSGRHRARWSSIMVLKVHQIADAECRRLRSTQFQGGNIKFPLPHIRQRTAFKKYRTSFKAKRPVTFISA